MVAVVVVAALVEWRLWARPVEEMKRRDGFAVALSFSFLISSKAVKTV